MPLLMRSLSRLERTARPAEGSWAARRPSGSELDSKVDARASGLLLPTGSDLAFRENPPVRAARRPASRRTALFSVCANPACAAGWLRLWRSRSAPVFEGGWCCSPQCTREQIQSALRHEFETSASAPDMHRHRIPLGLAMLEQGWLTADQLRRALGAQRQAGAGRLGHWLQRQGVSEALVTRALGLQWSCPVLPIEAQTPGSAALLPRLFVDAFGALPLRVAAERILYLGFEDRLDPALALAVEKMTGLRVESGVVAEARFRRAHALALEARYPAVELVEAASEAALAAALARAIERTPPLESKLVRVHDCVWLRMFFRPQAGAVPALDAVRDVIGSLACAV